MAGQSENDVNEIVHKILRAEDYEESSRLLIVLGRIDPHRAAQVALALLNKSVGDKYLRGFAFEMLYTDARPIAIKYLVENAAFTDLYIFKSMLSAVAEDAGVEDGKDEVWRAVLKLREALASRTSAEIAEIADTVDWFNSSFERW